MSVVVPSELFFISHAVAFQAAAPPPWRIQFMTPNIPQLTGYDVEDFLSGQRTLADIIHPLDHGRIGAIFAEDRNSFRIDDVRFLDHGGAERRGGIQGIILRNAEGKPQGLLGWIEEGRSPQADLAAVSAVLDSVDALVTIADMQTHDVLFMNSTARAVFGEGLGRKCWQLYQPQLSGPCPFCREHALLDVAGQPLNGVVWEQQSQLTGRWYERRDRAVRWLDGRMARLEIAIDRTRARQAQAALQESEERFRRLAEATWEAILIHDGEHVLDCNTVLEHLTACPREELIGRSVFDFLLPEQRDLVRTMIVAGTEHPYEVRVVRRDGVTFPVEVRGRNAILDGRVVRVAAIRDLSRQRAQESALRETEARMRAVVETTVDGILTVDEHGNIETHNPAVESIFGFEPGELEGRGLATLLADPPAGSLDQFASSVELMGRRKDGVIIPIYVVISEVRLEDRRLFTAIIRDLTKHKQLTERITYLANHDPLTELPNRTLFAERLDRILAQMPGGEAAGLAVLVVDVDGFSAINDHYGHEAANKLLQTLAGRLRQWLPEGNEPARIGTDHFAVALPGLTENSEVLQAAAAIRAAVGEPVPLMPQVTLNVTCRIGAVFFRRNGNNGVELLRAAELALSSAKRGEEGVGLLNAGYSASKAERQALARDIARAIEQDEFELFYQPQVTLETRQLIGSEALIRWRHPERGMVPPDRFIPVCEESGLIVPLGTWVIRTACRQARAWLDAGLPPLRVGINISGRQFAEPNLVEIVRAALDETGIDPQGIELEMTESMLIQDVQSTLRILGELKKLGVGLSIDDFGTGYSSLAYLRQFAVDRLKIDRAFVSELHRNEEDRLIVTAVISLAHSLGMTTIAEGVELASQEALLADYGCEEMQGFVFSRPLPVADFYAFAMAHHARSQAKAAIDAAEPVTMPAMHMPGYKRHISWKRSMSIDILSIDRQHEELVAEVNTLFKMLTDKAGIDKCLAQLETIIVKTVEHFTHEERVMRNINYPNYHQHKEKHEWLVRDVQRFKESFASKVDEDDMYSIYNYLKYWLLRHLIGEDRRIRDYMYRKV